MHKDRTRTGRDWFLTVTDAKTVEYLSVVGSLMVSILAFGKELDNGDRNGSNDDHMNVTALTQNKLQENPERHQYCKNNPHLITCRTNSGSELCDSTTG